MNAKVNEKKKTTIASICYYKTNYKTLDSSVAIKVSFEYSNERSHTCSKSLK